MDQRGKPMIHSGTLWPIALHEFVRAGGCPFDTSMRGDNGTRLAAEFHESTTPIPFLILLKKLACRLSVFLRNKLFLHIVNMSWVEPDSLTRRAGAGACCRFRFAHEHELVQRDGRVAESEVST